METLPPIDVRLLKLVVKVFNRPELLEKCNLHVKQMIGRWKILPAELRKLMLIDRISNLHQTSFALKWVYVL